MATGPSIDYAKLQQEAMRGVVRAVLQQIVKSGLPGEHHFYISFLTQAPGVILSKRLKEKYPSEMTIVLQHRFWDLIVSDERFEVKLTFDGIPERLVVPFTAIKVFIDPSVRFGLQFDEEVSDNEPLHQERHALTADATYDQMGDAGSEMPRAAPKKPRAPRRRTDKDTAASPAARRPSEPTPPSPEPAIRAGEATAKDDSENDVPPSTEGAKILSLDQFRKK
ncbi:SspB family protein [Hyphomicrobium sp.]|jgi:hypothetical protein|uniref:SspB family protein n=1 Tax=Hyphomicrobium sp. TaxID=82 RepID=UPI002CD45D0E|nr:ClpXP protease specificity-enhancing factor SspB [Hyphomicrobium sp.]HVZ03199.1 ClpXP protease specificity-enhancing factor SspB [Hyphomicrobium sp.]